MKKFLFVLFICSNSFGMEEGIVLPKTRPTLWEWFHDILPHPKAKGAGTENELNVLEINPRNQLNDFLTCIPNKEQKQFREELQTLDSKRQQLIYTQFQVRKPGKKLRKERRDALLDMIHHEMREQGIENKQNIEIQKQMLIIAEKQRISDRRKLVFTVFVTIITSGYSAYEIIMKST